jgi:hypothetical protein
MIEAAGFVRARLVGETGYRTSPYTMGTLFRAEKE